MVECGTQQIPQTTSGTELMVGNDPNLQGISNNEISFFSLHIVGNDPNLQGISNSERGTRVKKSVGNDPNLQGISNNEHSC